MISYIITFLVGSYLGVAFMCLFQINKKFTGSSPDISSTLVAGRTEVLDMVEERKILAKRVNELCKEKGLHTRNYHLSRKYLLILYYRWQMLR